MAWTMWNWRRPTSFATLPRDCGGLSLGQADPVRLTVRVARLCETGMAATGPGPARVATVTAYDPWRALAACMGWDDPQPATRGRPSPSSRSGVTPRSVGWRTRRTLLQPSEVRWRAGLDRRRASRGTSGSHG